MTEDVFIIPGSIRKPCMATTATQGIELHSQMVIYCQKFVLDKGTISKPYVSQHGFHPSFHYEVNFTSGMILSEIRTSLKFKV